MSFNQKASALPPLGAGAQQGGGFAAPMVPMAPGGPAGGYGGAQGGQPMVMMAAPGDAYGGQMMIPMQIDPATGAPIYPQYAPYAPWNPANAVHPYPPGDPAQLPPGVVPMAMDPNDPYARPVVLMGYPQQQQQPPPPPQQQQQQRQHRRHSSSSSSSNRRHRGETNWPLILCFAGCLLTPICWLGGAAWWKSKNSSIRTWARINVFSFILFFIILIIVVAS